MNQLKLSYLRLLNFYNQTQIIAKIVNCLIVNSLIRNYPKRKRSTRLELSEIPKEGSREAAIAESAESWDRNVMCATPSVSMRVRDMEP